LVLSVIFVGDYMTVLFLSYLELWMSDWGDIYCVRNLRIWPTFLM